MGADFKRIRKELLKLNPTLMEPFNRAFELMEEYKVEQKGPGIDLHHGLLKSLFPQYEDRKWNHVFLPRFIHIRVHLNLVSAFDETEYYLLFLDADIIRHAPSDGPLKKKKEHYKDKIIKWYNAGKASPWISKRTSISNVTILKWLHEWNINVRDSGESASLSHLGNKKSQFKDRIIIWYKSGKSATWVGKKINAGPATILRWLREWGLKIRDCGEAYSLMATKNKKAQFKDRIITWYKSGNSTIWIAKKVNISVSTISVWLHKWEIKIRTNSEVQNLRKQHKK